jgi:sec-independent protein translocase protein TatB
MFEVGFTELLLIGALALIVLGPERLPKLAQQLGRWAGRARAMARQLREQLDQEVNFQEQTTRRTSTSAGSSQNPDATPDVDANADPHDSRSHRDAGLAEPPSTAETSEPPPGFEAARESSTDVPGTGDESPVRNSP